MAALNAALDVDAHDWPTSVLAQVDNLHGNLLAPTDVAASLARHERALSRYGALPGFDNDTAYSLAQCVRRLVALTRVDDAEGLLDRLHALPVAQNAWVRNRCFEATLLIAHAVLTADAPRALRLAGRALAVPLHAANAYTLEAHVDLWCIVANAHRIVGDLDAGRAASARVRDDVVAREPREQNANYQRIAAWGLCEGAYVARRLDRPHDALSFLDVLPPLPLTVERAAYAAALRAWALLRLGDIAGANKAIDAARRPERLPAWVASALEVTIAERAELQGDAATARALAEELIVTQHNHDEPAPLGGNVGAVLVLEGLVLGTTPAVAVEDVETVATQTYLGTNGGDNFGHDVAVGDVDGDGRDDLVVGALFDEARAVDGGPAVVNNTGAVSLFVGRAGAFPDVVARDVYFGDNDGDRFGESVAVAGDVDGDSVVDLAVFAGTDDNNGFNVGVPFLVSSNPAVPKRALPLPGNAGGSELGRGAAIVGDVDGDGVSDLVVGAPENTLDPQGGSTGSLLVYRGQAGGAFSAAPDREWKLFAGHTAGDRLGFAVVDAGDFDDDGRGDFAVLGRSDDRPATFDGNHDGGAACQGALSNTGSMWIFSGARAFTENAPSFVYFPTTQVNQLSFTLAGNFDFNGDGRSDVALGSPEWDRGALSNVGGVEVLFGQAAGPATKVRVICDSNVRFLGLLANDNVGRSIAALPSIDGDNCDELVVGANGEDLGRGDQGSVRVIFGAGAGCNSAQPRVLTFVSEENGAQGGFAVAGGDVDGDGVADVVVGGFNHRRGADTAGIVWLIKGTRLATLAPQAEALVDNAAPARTFPILDVADSDRLFIEGANGADRIGNALALVARGTRFDVVIGSSQGGVAAANTGGARVFGVDGNGFSLVPRVVFAGETARRGSLLGELVSAGRAGGASVVLLGGFQASGTGLDEGGLYAGVVE